MSELEREIAERRSRLDEAYDEVIHQCLEDAATHLRAGRTKDAGLMLTMVRIALNVRHRDRHSNVVEFPRQTIKKQIAYVLTKSLTVTELQEQLPEVPIDAIRHTLACHRDLFERVDDGQTGRGVATRWVRR